MAIHILSIDDDEDILYTIQEICRSQGWEPLLARSFQQAEGILAQHAGKDPDLILIDYHLPKLDGISAVRRIRAMGITVPIIVLTIEEQSDVMQGFLAAGADDFSLKPIRLLDLVSRINTHLRYSEKEPAWGGPEKGINQATLAIIVECLQGQEDYLDVAQLEQLTRLNAKTIHRYLLYLARSGQVELKNIYGKRGRPRAFYKWNGPK